MTTITIPKKIVVKGDLVLIPRKEYEALLIRDTARTYAPTAIQKKALARAERNLKKKQTLTVHELSHELGFAH